MPGFAHNYMVYRIRHNMVLRSETLLPTAFGGSYIPVSCNFAVGMASVGHGGLLMA